MASKIHIPYYSVTNTLYVTIRDADGNVWNTSSKTFEVWSDLSLANYAVNAVYKEGSLYIAQFPTDISNGYFTIMIFLQGGVSPNVSTDIWIGTLDSYWDKNNSNLVPVRVDTMIEYSSGERFTEKALEEAGGGITIIERTPKVQVEGPQTVDTTSVPSEIEVLTPEVSHTSSAIIADDIKRKSSSRVGP